MNIWVLVAIGVGITLFIAILNRVQGVKHSIEVKFKEQDEQKIRLSRPQKKLKK